jgi:hypothetical protein
VVSSRLRFARIFIFSEKQTVTKFATFAKPKTLYAILKKTTQLKIDKMEPIALITTAIALATPYLLKTGESIAEGIGEDIWKLIKKPFTKDKKDEISIDINKQEDKDKLVTLLLEEIGKDNNFKQELETAVEKGQKDLNAYYQQNINNNGEIGKQINIQHNSGNIQIVHPNPAHLNSRNTLAAILKQTIWQNQEYL